MGEFGITTEEFMNQLMELNNIFSINEIKSIYKDKIHIPYKVIYRSKPIRGIVLELVTLNNE